MKIDINKKYKTGDGRVVDILKIYEGTGQEYPVKTYVYEKENVNNGALMDFTIEGIYSVLTVEPTLDLIEVSPYEEFKIDDKVIVWNAHDSVYKANMHFAGIAKNGKALTFDYGATSWSVQANHSRTEWDFCIKAGEDE
jgi:hypothetical protein